MQTAQQGDRVRVHYIKKFQDGSVTSSRDRAPLEVTIGSDHPRLPGLGLALVGLKPGAQVSVSVPPGRAHGVSDPARVRRWPRASFPKDQALPVGEWVSVADRRGRRRTVRIVEVSDRAVVIDTNHRRAGQSMVIEVELIGILAAEGEPELRRP